MPATLWIAVCTHRLQQRWHSVDPQDLEEVARELRRDARLRAMPPDEAAGDWLRPISQAEPPLALCRSPQLSLTGQPSLDA